MQPDLKINYYLPRLPVYISRCGSHSHDIDDELDSVQGMHSSDKRDSGDGCHDPGNIRMVRYVH